MIRSILMLMIAITALSLTGASHKSADAKSAKVKRHCKGYSVIEVDKGVDCHGDTIKLVKINGFFERAQ